MMAGSSSKVAEVPLAANGSTCGQTEDLEHVEHVWNRYRNAGEVIDFMLRNAWNRYLQDRVSCVCARKKGLFPDFAINEAQSASNTTHGSGT